MDEQQNDSYILASVDRFSRYTHAKVYHNCDADTAIAYLEKYIKVHGGPRNIRCDQAQAFKSRQFEIFCNNNRIKKLILAPAGVHRANDMIERLLQTIKRRLSVLINDLKWSNITLADKNTLISNITTQIFTKNLPYKGITNCYLDKMRGLKQPMLYAETIWNLQSDSEPELDIQFQQAINKDDSSDQSTLQNLKTRAIKRKTRAIKRKIK